MDTSARDWERWAKTDFGPFMYAERRFEIGAPVAGRDALVRCAELRLGGRR